jgi:hypothetical protein
MQGHVKTSQFCATPPNKRQPSQVAMDMSYADAVSWLEKADWSRADKTPSFTVECYGNAIIKLVASSHAQKAEMLASVVADATTFVINQLLAEETLDTEEEDLPEFFFKSVILLVTDGDISKKYLTRLLDVNITEADLVNDYIKELMTKKALESLIMTNATCLSLKAILESRSVRMHEPEPMDSPQARLHREIDSYLTSVSLLVRGDEQMDTVANHPEVIDHFVTAYEAARLSGSILLEAQCCSRAGTAYLKLNLREESNVFYGLCIGLCAPTQANSLRYADQAEFQKAQVELHRTEWLKDAVEGRGIIVIADEDLEVEVEGQRIAEASRLMHREAMGSPVKGGLHFVRYLLAEHPPRGQDQDKIDAIQASLDSHTGRPLMGQLKQVLRPTKFLYHPDRNRGLNPVIGQDLAWKLLSIEISKALNGFQIPGEKTVREPPSKGKCGRKY